MSALLPIVRSAAFMDEERVAYILCNIMAAGKVNINELSMHIVNPLQHTPLYEARFYPIVFESLLNMGADPFLFVEALSTGNENKYDVMYTAWNKKLGHATARRLRHKLWDMYEDSVQKKTPKDIQNIRSLACARHTQFYEVCLSDDNDDELWSKHFSSIQFHKVSI